MTIFNPSQQKNNIRFLIYLTCLILLGGTLLVLEYNSIAALRTKELSLQNNIEKAKVKNVEIKSNLYTITSAEKLEAAALTSSLTLDRAPRYLTYSE